MTDFKQVLIDPSNRELADVLAEAIRWAKRTFQVEIPGWSKFVRQLRTLPRSMSGAEGFISEPISEPEFLADESPIALAWWTDPHGRRHVHVLAAHDGNFRWDDAVPPLFLVYPDRLCLRTRGSGRPEVIAMCGCGVCGRPTDLAWTGPRCGPCADHREERLAARLPFEEPASVLRHASVLHDLTFSPDGRMLAGVDESEMVVAWDVRTGQAAWDEADELTRCVIFGPGLDWFVSAVANRYPVEVDLTTGRVRSVLFDGLEPPTAALALDGSRLMIGDEGGLFVCQSRSELAACRIEGWPNRQIHWMRLTDRGQRVFVLAGGDLFCFGLGTHEGERWSSPCRGVPAISADGQTLAVPTETHVALLEMATGQTRATLPAGPYVNGVAFHPRLRHLVTADVDGDIIVWSLANYQRHTTFLAQPQGITSMAMSPDGRLLATAASDGTVRLWTWEELLLA